MKQNALPFNLQYFAKSPEGGESDGGQVGQPQNPANLQSQNTLPFDYEKLASIINGKQTVTEDTVLKNYFKQQGLSQEEAAQAMQQFKEQKAKNTPDVEGIQTQLQQAQTLAQKEIVEKNAILEAVSLGLDAKTIPYILKMADFQEAIGQDGKVNNEALKNAINKVLEDIPQLKPTQEPSGGFQIGGAGGQQQQTSQSDQLAAIFGNKK